MKLCPSCGTRYEDAAKFCQHDGTLLREVGGGGEEEDPYVGKLLVGQFEVSEPVGSGGMGRVYKARQLGFDRPVAVKILHHELSANQEMVKRFNREARIISRLDHPAIIHVYLFGKLPDGNLFLAMEYVDGRPLTRLIGEGPVPATRAVHVADQILAALEEAHGKGVVHRDLKPDNIMLVSRGGDPDTVKVLDFGIAKFLGARTMLTQQGLVFGSARYISPEAAAGEEVDERADLYAVGVILYHMLAGVPPFDDASAVTLLMRHVNDPAPHLSKQPGARAVAPALAEAVMQALEKDPGSRYPDAAAMRTAILEAAKQGGVPFTPTVAAARWSAAPVRAEPDAPAAAPEGERPGFGTNPMFGARPASAPGGPAEPRRVVAPSAESSATRAALPSALAASRDAAAPPLPETRLSVAAPMLDEPSRSESFELDDEDDEPVVPRSRAWIVLLVLLGLLALAGGAAATLMATGGAGEREPAGATGGAETSVGVGPGAGAAETTPTATGPADAGAVEPADAGAVEPATELLAAGPAVGDAAAPPESVEPGPARVRTGAGGGDSRGGMPPSATIRVTPSRLRVGARAQIVARVDPPTAVRGPRFVISRRSGGEPAWHDASPGGEPGLYHLAHAFDRAGQYQITFVASTSHGEIRAFADATVAERAEGEHAEGAPAGGDPSSAVSPLAGGSSGAGPGPSPGSNADGDDEDKPPDAAPRSLSVPPSPLPPAVPSPFSSPYAAPW